MCSDERTIDNAFVNLHVMPGSTNARLNFHVMAFMKRNEARISVVCGMPSTLIARVFP
jgi:hypothetical protein